MIEIHNLSASYGRKTVLTEIHASASAGKFIALLGPNGSGKTTLLKSILGLHKFDSGRVSLGGKPLSQLSLKQRAKHMAYLAQSREAAWAMRVSDIVSLGRAPYRGALGQISEKGQDAINSAMEATGVTPFAKRNVNSLSGGELARVMLARALAVNAPVLLADEPIAALDPYYQLTMMQLLSAQARQGVCVIAALHDLTLARKYCDEIWVLHEGKLITRAAPHEALSADVLKTVFKIEATDQGYRPLPSP